MEYRRFEFDRFVLDPQAGRLLDGGREVPLRPQALEVLRVLVENAGQPVTKDQLFSTVWGKTIVTDDALVQCVSDIRGALADGEQRMVRTLPRRGYTFTAPVRQVDAGDATQAAVTQVGGLLPTAAPAPPPTSFTQSRKAAAAIAVLAVLLGVAGWLAIPHRGSGDMAARPLPLSIVVLPFVNLNGDPEQEYFAEGVTEDLTTDLSRIPGSFVVARSSAYWWKGKAADVRQIGRQLGVRYALEGSVQRLDEDVRLNVQLVDVQSGRALWAERFDGRRRDLAGLQQKVTGTIARSLHLELIEAESERAQRERALNPLAHDLALQGWSWYERRTPESVAQARALLLRSVATDPSSAFAWSLLADTYTADLLNRWMHLRGATRSDWLHRAAQAAEKATALDPNNLYAVGARATVLQLQGKPEDSLALLKKQVALNRNYAPAWHRISYAETALGRPDAAIDAGNEAIRLSPRDGRLYSFYAVMAAACLHAGRDADALSWAQRSAQDRPDFGTAYSWIAAAAAQLGDMNKARAALTEFRRLQPDYTISTFRAEGISTDPQFLRQHERYYEGLRKAGLPE